MIVRDGRRHLHLRRGITLMEVLATLLLVGIVLPVAMHGITLSMQAASSARHRTEAAQLAEWKLNELLALRDANTLSGSGTFGDDWPEYRWEAESTQADYGTYDVAVTVRWAERGQERSLTLASIVYPNGAVTE